MIHVDLRKNFDIFDLFKDIIGIMIARWIVREYLNGR